LIDQLVVLSGGKGVNVKHEACEARGDNACLFRVRWERG
jgi:predicted hydrocarbon binding protein